MTNMRREKREKRKGKRERKRRESTMQHSVV